MKKAVSWVLRAIGRRSLELNAAALAVANRLALSEEASSRWVGKDTLRELSSSKVRSQLARPKSALRSGLEFHAEWLRDEPIDATATETGSYIPLDRCQLSPGNGDHEIWD